MNPKLKGICTLVLSLTLPAWAQNNRIDQIRPDAPELAAYGNMSIGVRTLQLVNPGQLDIVKAKPGETIPTGDRRLTVEVWYPSAPAPAGNTGEYRTFTRDPKNEVSIYGKAARNAMPDSSQGPYPLVIVSHGYPGNRYLLSHLAENLASKGYVVASIDHTDSTYSDQANFASTLLNRPLDQLFVLNAMAQLHAGQSTDAAQGAFKGMIHADQTALIGYSMGAYGVVNTLGGGFSEKAVASPMAPPNGALKIRQAGNPAYTATLDPRIKAGIAIAPWGWNAGLWDAQGLAQIQTPIFFMAGSADDVSGYSPGVRNIFEASARAPRYLLTFEHANHNAAAPMPAPRETWATVPHMPNSPAAHYIDAVWDSTRMNNIAQHFATAFLGKYLRQDNNMDAYLNLLESAQSGKWSTQANGTLNSDHTYWKGFPRRTAVGLKLEKRMP